MAEQTVTAQDGTTRLVVAPDAGDLKGAVAEVKAQTERPTFDINVPVQKGHDLLNQTLDSDVVALDGTGAHNSPLPAINEDTAEVRGSDPLFVAPSNQVVERQLVEVTGPGETKEVTAEEVANSVSVADKEADTSTAKS